VRQVIKLHPGGLPPRQQDPEPHVFCPICTHVAGGGWNTQLIRSLGSFVPCFWFVEEHTAPAELEAKQDHDLVVRDLSLVCADYQGLLRLNKHWMEARHFSTASRLAGLCREAVSWAWSCPELHLEDVGCKQAESKLSRHPCVLLWLRNGVGEAKSPFPQRLWAEE